MGFKEMIGPSALGRAPCLPGEALNALPASRASWLAAASQQKPWKQTDAN